MLSIIEKRAITVLKRCITLNNLHTHSQQSPLLLETIVRWNCPLSNNDRPNSRIINRTMVVVTQTKASEESTTSNSATAAAATLEHNNNVTTSPSSTMSHEQQQDQQLSAIVTDACYQRIRYLITQKMKQQQTDNDNNSSNDDHLYLRVFVDAGGCSGFTYQFELDKDSNLNPEEDVVFTDPIPNNDVVARVVVDRGSLNLINGSTIDYVQEMIKSTFEVRDNPQSESACGCGSSFALKNFASNPAID